MVNTGDSFADMLDVVLKIFGFLSIGSIATVIAYFAKIRGYLQSADRSFKKGSRLTKRGKYDKAIKWYDKAIERDYKSVGAIEQSAISHIRAKSFTKQSCTKMIHLLTEQTRTVADTINLIEIYKKRRVDEPENPDHVNKLQECHLFLENHVEQVEKYKGLARWLGWRARCLSDNPATYIQAEQDIASALLIDPCCTLVHYAHGYLLHIKGKYEDAINANTEAIRLDPSFATAHNNRGWDCAALVIKDEAFKKEALKNFDKAIKLDPKHALAYGNRGYCYYRLGEYKDAIRDCKTSIRINRKNPLAYLILGHIYLKLEKYKKAIRNYTKAIKVDPRQTRAYRSRDYAYDAIGRNDLSVADREKRDEIEFIMNQGE